MKSLVILAVVTMLAGCDFAAGPRTYLHGVARAGAASDSTVVTGITSTETAAALALVERVLIAHGFHRDRRFHEPELLVAYTGEYRSDGSTPLCYVYDRAQHGVIEVWLHEWGRFHPSDVVAAADAELFTALQTRFGASRVTRREKA